MVHLPSPALSSIHPISEYALSAIHRVGSISARLHHLSIGGLFVGLGVVVLLLGALLGGACGLLFIYSRAGTPENPSAPDERN